MRMSQEPRFDINVRTRICCRTDHEHKTVDVLEADGDRDVVAAEAELHPLLEADAGLNHTHEPKVLATQT